MKNCSSSLDQNNLVQLLTGNPASVSGVLVSPTNVRLSSNNLDLVLKWDPPDGSPSGVIYTTEFKSSVSGYRNGCVNISAPECDLTSSVSRYGTYTGRVRVLLGAESSPWVESNQIIPDKDTIIGSPNVSVLSNGWTLEVSITDPEFHDSSLRDVYSSASYNITYWKRGQEEKSKYELVKQTRVVLNNLDPKSEYCVQVRIVTDRNPNPSKSSSIICESTTDEESQWVPAVIASVVMVGVVALVVLVVLNWTKISQSLFPKEALPQHIEALLATPKSSMFLAMSSELVEEINSVSIVAAERTSEDGRTAQDKRTAEDGRTAQDKRTAEDRRTAEDGGTAEDRRTTQDKRTAEDGTTAEDGCPLLEAESLCNKQSNSSTGDRQVDKDNQEERIDPVLGLWTSS
ncbi:interleukin-10 receptor subunit beta [Nematolebias whitei]|uniref:interleukin-10 receptor subunit beta n=1 Tax=Nematolebias whitei TaxID=451745 RepID=UPI001896D23F|nr:interleukin-10 receptor subunit beta [Nematolebias whitei]